MDTTNILTYKIVTNDKSYIENIYIFKCNGCNTITSASPSYNNSNNNKNETEVMMVMTRKTEPGSATKTMP